MAKIKLTGFRELDAALATLPKATGKGVLRRAGKQALEPMRAIAQANAPVAKEPYVVGSFEKGTLRTVLPGRTKRSIVISQKRTRRAKSGRARRVFVDGRWRTEGGSDAVSLAMGPSAGDGALNNATRQEFGNSQYAAHPYMRPAWDAQAQPTIERLGKALWNEIFKAAARAAKKRAKS